MLREAFPLLRDVAHLNAGSNGPVPEASVRAAHEELQRALIHGRASSHLRRRRELAGALRAGYAARLGAAAQDVALTTCTTEGVARVLAGLGLGPGDEVLTSDEEHPGVLGPLAAQRRRGVAVRVVALADLAHAVGPRTRLVACSHVSWLSGSRAPAELAAVGAPVLLDGAQSIGAVPVDVAGLGCAFYAGSGQKWLCGPDGTGMLYVAPGWRGRLAPAAPGNSNLADPERGLDAMPHPDARRFDVPVLANETLAGALAALEVLEGADLGAAHALAARAADALRERGRAVAPRDDTTLVAWDSADPAAEVAVLAAAGVVVRALPGTSRVRASFGPWNDGRDLERLLAALPGPAGRGSPQTASS